MKIGNADITDVKIGNISVSEVRIGETLVWQKAQPLLMVSPNVTTEEEPIPEETPIYQEESVLSNVWTFLVNLFKFK